MPKKCNKRSTFKPDWGAQAYARIWGELQERKTHQELAQSFGGLTRWGTGQAHATVVQMPGVEGEGPMQTSTEGGWVGQGQINDCTQIELGKETVPLVEKRL